MSHRHFEFEPVGRVAIVRLSTKHIREQAAIEEFGEDLQALFDAGSRERFVINFAATEFISSAVTSQIIALQRKAEKIERGGLRLCCVPEPVMRAFRTQRLVVDGDDSYLKVFATETAAIEHPWPDQRA